MKFIDLLRTITLKVYLKYLSLNIVLMIILCPLGILFMTIMGLLMWIVFLIEYCKYGRDAWRKQGEDQMEWIDRMIRQINEES